MSLSTAVNVFRKNISYSWQEVRETLLGHESGLDDWLQAVWESIVEAYIYRSCGLPIFLEIYGCGADCNPKSSRHSLPDKLPTHIVMGVVKFPANDAITGLPVALGVMKFDRFGTVVSGFFDECPPFDVAVLVDNNDVSNYLSVDALDWEVCALE